MIIALFLLITPLAYTQVDKIVIPAGTAEDQALNAINSEQDPQKKLSMYNDFVEKFASNPVAVAYGNWQLLQYYQSTGGVQKAVEYGDKAVAAAPHNMDILSSQVAAARKLKDKACRFRYSVMGGEV